MPYTLSIRFIAKFERLLTHPNCLLYRYDISKMKQNPSNSCACGVFWEGRLALVCFLTPWHRSLYDDSIHPRKLRSWGSNFLVEMQHIVIFPLIYLVYWRPFLVENSPLQMIKIFSTAPFRRLELGENSWIRMTPLSSWPKLFRSIFILL